MYKIALLLCLCFPYVCYAQPRRIDLGFSASAYIKANPISGANINTRLLGAAGLEALLRVNGVEEKSMAFQLAAGIEEDIRTFILTVNTKVRIGQFLGKINPSVIIRSRWEHIHYNIGIGALVNAGHSISFFTEDLPYGPAPTSADTVDKVINNNGKAIVPFVSLGFTADIKKHFQLHFSIEPTLTNFYEHGTVINYHSNSTVHDIELEYQPVYFGIKLVYFIHPRLEY